MKNAVVKCTVHRTKIDFETDIKTNWNSSFVDNKIISFMHIYFTFLQATIGWRWIRASLFTRFNGYVVTVLFYIFLPFILFYFGGCPRIFPERRKMVLCVFHTSRFSCVCVFFSTIETASLSLVSHRFWDLIPLCWKFLVYFSCMVFFSILSFIWYGISSSYSFIA